MAQVQAGVTEECEPSPESQRLIIALCLLLLAGLSWAWLVEQATYVRSAATAMAAMPGMPATAAPQLWTYIPASALTWFLMMVAMMLPSAAPLVFLYGRFTLASRSPIKSTLVIVSVYLAIWAGFSVTAAVAQYLLVRFGVASEATLAIGDRRLGGMLLILAGLYQFSKLKSVCLDACRSPLSFVIRLWRPGWRGAANIGAHHGLHCLGCNWLLMGLLFVGGVMNLTWVVGLAFLVLIEKTAPHGQRLAQAAGVVALVWGVVLVMSSALVR
jgi:predicted metal-binding membrane protein